jgi:putative ABC transport system ATP-binding protein
MGMAIHLEQVVKRFTRPSGDSITVLAGIELSCGPGDGLCVEGPSGSGKSTLLNVIAGLYQPDEGSVRIGQTRLGTLGERARDRFRAAHIGYVFQTFNLLSPLSALENLTVVAALTGQRDDPAERAERAKAILASLGLDHQWDKRPYELSVGQRQRVAVARALLQRPEVLLADEPTANLDPAAGTQVIASLLELYRAGTTLVIATHDPAVRTALAAPVLHVDQGVLSS